MPAVFDANLTPTPSAQTAVNTSTVTTGAAAAANSKIFGLLFFFATGGQVLNSVTGGSLTWTIPLTAANGSFKMAIVSADAPSGLASSTTLNGNFSGTVDPATAFWSATGMATGTANDGTISSSSGAGASWSSGALSTVNADDLLVAGGGQDGSGTATATPNTNYTEVNDWNASANTESWETVYRIVSSAASYTAGGSFSPSGSTSIGGMVAFAAAAVITGMAQNRPMLMRLAGTRVQQFLGFPQQDTTPPPAPPFIPPPWPFVVDTAVSQSVNN